MSEEEDLRTLRGVYDDWARGEFWDVSAHDPEIEFVLGPSLPEPGTYHGHEGMEKGFRGWLDSWRDLRFEAEEFIGAGEGRIVVLFRQTGIGKTSGLEAELHGGHLWTMLDGKAVRLEVHAHRHEALEAAGLGRWAMSQGDVWNLQISFVGSGEEAGRASGIIIAARKRGKPVYGEGPWWNVSYEAHETGSAALAALSVDLDEIDPGWRDILAIR